MLKYIIYLIIYILLQIITYIITPILPLFAVNRLGWSDNHNALRIEPRLPLWLSWFDTPDNSFGRDGNFMSKWSEGYWSKVFGLYRNSLYGFKWTVMGARIVSDRVFDGNPQVNYHEPVYGLLRVSCGKYWQYKKVVPSKIFIGYCWVLNFGWLLDDPKQDIALWMFSPRLKKVEHYART